MPLFLSFFFFVYVALKAAAENYREKTHIYRKRKKNNQPCVVCCAVSTY